MINNDGRIDTLRCHLLINDTRLAQKLLHSPLLKSDNLAKTITPIVQKFTSDNNLNINQLVINLGTLSPVQFATQFNQRLTQALMAHLIQLRGGGDTLAPQRPADTVQTNVSKQPNPASTEREKAEIYQTALLCLQPAALRQILQTSDHPQRQALVTLMSTRTEPGDTAPLFSPPWRRRCQISFTALVYLLNTPRGRRWLSQHNPTPELLTLWQDGIINGEITPPQALQLLDIGNLPGAPAQQAVITRHWRRPLWQKIAVRKAISKQSGKQRVTHIEADYKQVSSLSPPSQPVSNAGLVLLWPLLPQFFSLLALTEEKTFISEETCWQAVQALDWLVWGDASPSAERLLLNRLLCGIAPEIPLPPLSPFSPEQQQLTDNWLTAVTRQLPAWQSLSLTDIRQLFLQRAGELVIESRPPKLVIKPEAWDVLLSHWPWPLTLAHFPWLDSPLTLEWPGSGYPVP